MSKKHPGSPEMNRYQADGPPIEHEKPENEPPHHDWHELEKLLTSQIESKRSLAASKPRRKATRKPAKKQQPLL